MRAPVQIPQTQTTAPVSGAGSSIEEAIKSTSTVENTAAPSASQASSQVAGTLDCAFPMHVSPFRRPSASSVQDKRSRISLLQCTLYRSWPVLPGTPLLALMTPSASPHNLGEMHGGWTALTGAHNAAAGSAGDAASGLIDRAADSASKLAEQGGSLPDAAASTSQAAPGAIEAAGQRLSCISLHVHQSVQAYFYRKRVWSG